MSENERMLTTHQLAQRLSLRPRGIEGLVCQGKLPCYKISQRIVRFRWGEVKAALQKYRTKVK